MSIVNLIHDITLNQIMQYLALNDWLLDNEFKNNKLKVFNKDDYTITLPSNENYKDYLLRLNEAINLLSEINSQKLTDVIEEIKNISRDRLSFRIIGKTSQNGRIPLFYASTCVNAIKSLIISAGCCEEEPKPFYNKLPNDSRKFSNGFEFAQTQVGSFIFNIDTKDFMKENNQFVIDDNGNIKLDIPIERKIIKRVVKGLRQIEKNSYFSLEKVYDSGYIEGINANMCDAILQFREISEDVEIESIIIPSRIFNEDNLNEEKILIDKLAFNTAELISKTYKDEQKYLDILITCSVQHISADKTGEASGTVVVKFFYPTDNKEHHAKMYLEGNSFKDACEALKNNTTKVLVGGILNMTKVRWEFEQIERFEIIK